MSTAIGTALLVIDVQNHVLDPARHPPRPAFDERARGLVLPSLRRLLPAARAAGVEVVYTVMEDLTRDGRDRGLDYKLSGMSVPKDSWGARVAAEVAPAGDEIVLPKTSACLFHSTAFDYVARNLGVERILCAGFLTDQCVEQTVKAGAARGFAMACVEDACAANGPARHAAAEGHVRVGRMDAQTLRLAEEIGAGLIVIPNRTGDAFERILLGRETESVLRHASCPVLVVRAAE